MSILSILPISLNFCLSLLTCAWHSLWGISVSSFFYPIPPLSPVYAAVVQWEKYNIEQQLTFIRGFLGARHHDWCFTYMFPGSSQEPYEVRLLLPHWQIWKLRLPELNAWPRHMVSQWEAWDRCLSAKSVFLLHGEHLPTLHWEGGWPASAWARGSEGLLCLPHPTDSTS